MVVSLKFFHVSPLDSFVLPRKTALLCIKLRGFFTENASSHEDKRMLNVSGGFPKPWTKAKDSRGVAVCVSVALTFLLLLLRHPSASAASDIRTFQTLSTHQGCFSITTYASLIIETGTCHLSCTQTQIYTHI